MALTGDPVVAVATVSDRQDTSGTTTSTSYTATLTGGTTCSAVFVAPPSGAVIIHNRFYGFNGGANFNFCSREVRAGAVVGSGTVFSAANDNTAVVRNGVSADGSPDHVTGLTAGSTYNVRQMFRVDGNTGTFIYKHLIVQPCI